MLRQYLLFLLPGFLLPGVLLSCRQEKEQATSPYVAKQDSIIYWAVTPIMDSNSLSLMSRTLLEKGIFFTPIVDRDEKGQPVRIHGNIIVFDKKRTKLTDTLLSNRLIRPYQQKKCLASQSIDAGHTEATLLIPPLGFWYDPKTGLHSDRVGANFPIPLRTRVEEDFPPAAVTQLEKENTLRVRAFKNALAKGKPAFPFTLPDTSGKKISLSEYKGKVVYLDFWAHWCQPCMQEMRKTKRLKSRLQKYPDVVLLYVSLDELKDKDKWIAAINRNGFSGTHVLAAGGFASAIPRLYGINEIPTKFIIDRNGNFYTGKLPSPLEGEQLVSLLEKALLEK